MASCAAPPCALVARVTPPRARCRRRAVTAVGRRDNVACARAQVAGEATAAIGSAGLALRDPGGRDG